MNKQHIIGAVTIALCVLAVYFGHHENSKLDAFEKWKVDFGVKFAQDENVFRRMIFERNVAKIQAHNAD